MIQEERLKKFLHEIPLLDWVSFNKLIIRDQGKRIHEIMERFKAIIVEIPTADFDAVSIILDSFTEPYEKLEIIGKSKHFFRGYYNKSIGGLAFLASFKRNLKDLEYEREKKHSKDKCDCLIAEKFSKAPLYDHMKKIGWINDHYYFPDVYICKVCNTRWTSFVNDDDLGYTSWEKYSSQDDDHLILGSK